MEVWLAQRKSNKKVFLCSRPTQAEKILLTNRAEGDVTNLQQRVKWKDWGCLQGGTPPVRGGELALWEGPFLFYNDTALSSVLCLKESWIFLPTPLIQPSWWDGQKQPAIHSSPASVWAPSIVTLSFKLKLEDYVSFISVNDGLIFWIFMILSIIITFSSGEEKHEEQYVYENKHKRSSQYSW